LYSNTTGYDNSAFGHNALFNNNTGFENTACGEEALHENTTGFANTAVGENALYYNTTGDLNTAVGEEAGAGVPNINFIHCTFIGARSSPTVNRTNVTMLGFGIANAQCTGDNQVLLGNTAITQIRAQVTGITAYSDARFKSNIKDDVKGLDFIMKLRPVSYNQNPEILHQIWGTPDSLVRQIDHSEIKQQRFVGLIAQEVEQAMKESGYTHFPGIDVPKGKKEVYSIRYGDLIMPMIKAIQEQQAQHEKQQILIETLQNQIVALQRQNAELLQLIKR
ncbi:MAG: tail fiber domain-containing protein, partial [Chitinophagales bacterium]|nr:tail fiber domain-containing protein [Chitinophagales bacterium]